MNRKRLSDISSILFSVILLSLSIWAIKEELSHYHFHQVWQSITVIPTAHILTAIALTGFNYLILTGYDTLAVYYIHHPLPYQKTALVALISYAISNSVGLALLSGSAIRYRFYRAWGLSAIEIAQIIAFCNLSFWLGLFTVGGILFLVEPLKIPGVLHLPFSTVHPVAILFLAVVFAYLGLIVIRKKPLTIGKWTLRYMPLNLCLAQIITTSLDWGLASAVLYILLPSSVSLSYPVFFAIYLLAQIAGLVSNVPGGLGVFETVILLLLSPSVHSPALFGSLLAYRGIYYFLPLITAFLLLGFYELRRHLRSKKY
jgi:uncharacterized membrane protein YbhN (UPF0104 family)